LFCFDVPLNFLGHERGATVRLLGVDEDLFAVQRDEVLVDAFRLHLEAYALEGLAGVQA